MSNEATYVSFAKKAFNGTKPPSSQVQNGQITFDTSTGYLYITFLSAGGTKITQPVVDTKEAIEVSWANFNNHSKPCEKTGWYKFIDGENYLSNFPENEKIHYAVMRTDAISDNNYRQTLYGANGNTYVRQCNSTTAADSENGWYYGPWVRQNSVVQKTFEVNSNSEFKSTLNKLTTPGWYMIHAIDSNGNRIKLNSLQYLNQFYGTDDYQYYYVHVTSYCDGSNNDYCRQTLYRGEQSEDKVVFQRDKYLKKTTDADGKETSERIFSSWKIVEYGGKPIPIHLTKINSAKLPTGTYAIKNNNVIFPSGTEVKAYDPTSVDTEINDKKKYYIHVDGNNTGFKFEESSLYVINRVNNHHSVQFLINTEKENTVIFSRHQKDTNHWYGWQFVTDPALAGQGTSSVKLQIKEYTKDKVNTYAADQTPLKKLSTGAYVITFSTSDLLKERNWESEDKIPDKATRDAVKDAKKLKINDKIIYHPRIIVTNINEDQTIQVIYGVERGASNNQSAAGIYTLTRMKVGGKWTGWEGLKTSSNHKFTSWNAVKFTQTGLYGVEITGTDSDDKSLPPITCGWGIVDVKAYADYSRMTLYPIGSNDKSYRLHRSYNKPKKDDKGKVIAGGWTKWMWEEDPVQNANTYITNVLSRGVPSKHERIQLKHAERVDTKDGKEGYWTEKITRPKAFITYSYKSGDTTKYANITVYANILKYKYSNIHDIKISTPYEKEIFNTASGTTHFVPVLNGTNNALNKSSDGITLDNIKDTCFLDLYAAIFGKNTPSDAKFVARAIVTEDNRNKTIHYEYSTSPTSVKQLYYNIFSTSGNLYHKGCILAIDTASEDTNASTKTSVTPYAPPDIRAANVTSSSKSVKKKLNSSFFPRSRRYFVDYIYGIDKQ